MLFHRLKRSLYSRCMHKAHGFSALVRRGPPRLIGYFMKISIDFAGQHVMPEQIRYSTFIQSLYILPMSIVIRYFYSIFMSNEFGASKGNLVWEKRWKKAKSKRVLMVCDRDFSGSFYRWGECLNQHTNYAARMLSFNAYCYDYDIDMLCVTNQINGLLKLAEQADIIHFKMEHYYSFQNRNTPAFLFFRKILKGSQFKNKRLVFTHYGGFARKYKNDLAYRQFTKQFHARVAMTPDLNYDWFEGDYICHAIDAQAHPYCWQDVNVLSHSPSNLKRKGTSQILQSIDAVNAFKDTWKFVLITGVSYATCLERKKKSSLFFEQAGSESIEQLGVDDVIGNYANAALEAMVCGIPTIAHISEHAFQGADRAGKLDWRKECPILNTPPMNPDGFAKTIQDFIDLPHEARKEISLKTRQFVEKFHDYPVVANELAEVYDRIL